MSSDFLLRYGGRRLRQYVEQPPLDGHGDAAHEEDNGSTVSLDFEMPPDAWRPRSVESAALDPSAMPRRFIDGCHAGETIAWLRDDAGHPIPVRLAQIGGVCLRIDGRTPRREFERVQRVVSLVADPFPEDEVEGFAAELSARSLRLLRAMPPKNEAGKRELTYDFERMREQTRVRAQHEMATLEQYACLHAPDLFSMIDGRLGRIERDDLARFDVVGVIKQHRENYLHPRGWQVLYELRPGERTPAFQLPSKHLPVVSWYLKLDGARGSMPNWGVVRIEISCGQFERQRCNFDYLDRLSHALLFLRCRQVSYERAPVSLEPIVWAEASLKALFERPDTLAQRFYHWTGL
jgi:hypothetical protein